LSPFIIFRTDSSTCCRGFTLIELIVVITLISVMMVFAVPRLHSDLLASDTRKVSKWMVLTVKKLKEASVRTRALHLLRIDMDKNRLWTQTGAGSLPGGDSFETTEAQKILEGLEGGKTGNELELPAGFRVIDVTFAGREPLISGVADIRFRQEGYSDYVQIHLEDDRGGKHTYTIEPFLPRIVIHEGYVEF
jgi:prepilin-type N-terminal cleavage/methylation domain-containing protein